MRHQKNLHINLEGDESQKNISIQNTIDFKLSGKLALLFCLERNGFDSDKTVLLISNGVAYNLPLTKTLITKYVLGQLGFFAQSSANRRVYVRLAQLIRVGFDISLLTGRASVTIISIRL